MPTFDDLEVDEACAKVLDHLARRDASDRLEVEVEAAHGRVLATDIFATTPSPREPRAIMDGYALRVDAEDPVSRTFAVVGESAAGRLFAGSLAKSQAIRVSTGAVVPAAASVVVAQEDTARVGDELTISEGASLRAGGFIRAAGSDWEPGSLRLARGDTIGPAELAMLIALERPTVSVFARPSVAIISTGDELLGRDDAYRAGAVRSSNGAMLAAQVTKAGGDVIANLVVQDDPAQLHDALRQLEGADLILTSGGVSVGDHDHVHGALEARDAEVLFRRVRMRPGRPLTVAATAGCLICALPGNPASSWATFELIARPALRYLAGVRRERCPLVQVYAPVAEAVTPLQTRDLFLRAAIRDGAAHPLPRQASGNLASITGADCLVRVPVGGATIPARTPLRTYLVES